MPIIATLTLLGLVLLGYWIGRSAAGTLRGTGTILIAGAVVLLMVTTLHTLT